VNDLNVTEGEIRKGNPVLVHAKKSNW